MEALNRCRGMEILNISRVQKSKQLFNLLTYLVSAIAWMRVVENKQKYGAKALGDRHVVLEKDDEDIMDRKTD